MVVAVILRGVGDNTRTARKNNDSGRMMLSNFFMVKLLFIVFFYMKINIKAD